MRINLAKIITLAILAACIVAMFSIALGCQVSKKNTLPAVFGSGELKNTGVWALSSYSAVLSATDFSLHIDRDTIPVGKMDTVHVLMLLSDGCRDKGWNTDNKNAFAAGGYEVRIRRAYQYTAGYMCANCPNYWEHVEYLDPFKKKLKDCYTVWQIK